MSLADSRVQPRTITIRTMRLHVRAIGNNPPACRIVREDRALLIGLYALAPAPGVLDPDHWIELSIDGKSYFREHPDIFAAGWFDLSGVPLSIGGNWKATLDASFPVVVWLRLMVQE